MNINFLNKDLLKEINTANNKLKIIWGNLKAEKTIYLKIKNIFVIEKINETTKLWYQVDNVVENGFGDYKGLPPYTYFLVRQFKKVKQSYFIDSNFK